MEYSVRTVLRADYGDTVHTSTHVRTDYLRIRTKDFLSLSAGEIKTRDLRGVGTQNRATLIPKQPRRCRLNIERSLLKLPVPGPFHAVDQPDFWDGGMDRMGWIKSR